MPKPPTQPPKMLSKEDKKFIQLISEGKKKAPAFREAYPEHHLVKRWNGSEGEAKQYAAALIVSASKTKLQAQYMRGALTTYQDKMEQFSTLAVDTAIELVKGARSEKVRADLAIEGIRHRVGTPVQKVAVQGQKVVTLTFGKPTYTEDN